MEADNQVINDYVTCELMTSARQSFITAISIDTVIVIIIFSPKT